MTDGEDGTPDAGTATDPAGLTGQTAPSPGVIMAPASAAAVAAVSAFGRLRPAPTTLTHHAGHLLGLSPRLPEFLASDNHQIRLLGRGGTVSSGRAIAAGFRANRPRPDSAAPDECEDLTLVCFPLSPSITRVARRDSAQPEPQHVTPLSEGRPAVVSAPCHQGEWAPISRPR